MAQLPADSLRNRSFVGLIIAQFLAGFNDQAIHASAMFYALHKGVDEAMAISLMPILFYSPWAIFCTLAGYFADRYSKTRALVIWKFSEIVISLVMVGGFVLGMQGGHTSDLLSVIIIMSTVFMMGTHAAFFAPAKYGAMPEILQAHVLSRGNGILESTTFLASILGTVVGGLLFFTFKDKEYLIGVTLLVLSIIGALASLMIAKLPVGNPTKVLPRNIYQPLLASLRCIFGSNPVRLGCLGIAFFIFMVAYMRSTMYMHGQSRIPPWDEFHTSWVVATVALGVGIGSPLAGFLSGHKIELGLVPLGCLGMIFACVLAGLMLDHNPALITSLIIIGFFSGFYMVPLYTLVQHRAPKAEKGDILAASNFINVTGAISASLLFGCLVFLGKWSGITPLVTNQHDVARGTFISSAAKKDDEEGVVGRLTLLQDDGTEFSVGRRVKGVQTGEGKTLILVPAHRLEPGEPLVVSKYQIKDVTYYRARPADAEMKKVYDTEGLPRFLFFGAAAMALGILLMLLRLLPDFFVRSLFWLRSLGKFQVKAVGMNRLPTDGPIILVTNAHDVDSSLQLVSATDRATVVVLPEETERGSLLCALARRVNLVSLRSDNSEQAQSRALLSLKRGNLLAVAVDGQLATEHVESFLHGVREASGAPVLPVFCGPSGVDREHVRVIFGAPVASEEPLDTIRARIAELKDWTAVDEH
jgi:MFS family permease